MLCEKKIFDLYVYSCMEEVSTTLFFIPKETLNNIAFLCLSLVYECKWWRW